MQYILTQEEFNELQEKAKKITEDGQKLIADLCRRIANSEPVAISWANTDAPWGCVQDHDDHYCDHCPVQDVCPHPWKYWSK